MTRSSGGGFATPRQPESTTHGPEAPLTGAAPRGASATSFCTPAAGSPFVFSRDRFDRLEGVTLTSAPLPTIDTTPIVIDGASPPPPAGLRTGQTLTLRDGGVLGDNFAVVDATLNIEGGVTAPGVEFVGSVVNISGGTVGDDFRAFTGSTVSISSGTVGDFFRAFNGSTVSINGGTIGDFFSVNTGSTVSITGGTLGSSFFVGSGGTVSIGGGTLGDGFRAVSGSMVNVSGTEFFLDGVLLDLEPGLPMLIADRDVILSGLLADGTLFEFDLFSTSMSGQDFFSPGATLTLTLVPEPSSAVLLGLLTAAIICRRFDR